MSEKIPISLRNSDLFLKPEFRDTNRKEINIDTTKYHVVEKGPTLGENNQFRCLHTSLCENKDQNGNQNPDMERGTRQVRYELGSRLRSHSKGVAKAKLLVGVSPSFKNQVFSYPSEQKDSFFVKHPKQSFGTVRYDKLDKVDLSTKNKQIFGQFDDKLDNHIKTSSSTWFLLKEVVQPFNLFKLNSYSLAKRSFATPSRIFLYKCSTTFAKASSFATLLSSGISREFLFVSINLILFSIVAVVQRSHYGKNSCLPGRKEAYKMLCGSKLPNIISCSEFSTANVRQDLYKIIPKQFKPVQHHRDFTKLLGDETQKHLVGIFSERCDLNGFTRSGVKCSSGENVWTPYTLKQSFEKHRFASFCVSSINKPSKSLFCLLRLKDGLTSKASLLPERSSDPRTEFWLYKSLAFATEQVPGFSIKKGLTPRLLPTKGNAKLLSTNQVQKLAAFKDYLIQPWYCIKICNTLNTKIIATRSLCESKVLISQAGNNLPYLLKGNLSKLDILYNYDTIKGFQYYLPFYTSSERVFAESDTIPSKRDTVCFKKTSHFNRSYKPELSSRINLSESILKRCFYRYGFLVVPPSKEVNSEHGALCKQDIREIKNSFASTNKRDIDLNANSEILPACSSSATPNDLKKSSSISFITLKRLQTSNPFCFVPVTTTLFCCKSKAFPELLVSNQSSDSSDLPRFGLPKNVFLKGLLPVVKGLLPVVSEPGFSQYLSLLNEIEKFSQSQKKEKIVNNGYFSPPRSFLVKHKHKLTQINFSTFVEMRNRTRTCTFMPDTLVPNTSVSGYQFPELQNRQIAYLFRKQALFHFHLNPFNNKTLFQKLFTQLTTAFRTFKSDNLVSQVLSTSFLTNQNGVVRVQIKTKSLPRYLLYQDLKVPKCIACDEPKLGFVTKGEVVLFNPYLAKTNRLEPEQSSSNQNYVLPELEQKARLFVSSGAKQEIGNPTYQDISPAASERVSERADGIRMRYTQVDLDDIKNIKNLFARLDRDYEQYLRQPKDSLPALIISPSLEDDLEIEEEGIRIFRKRDLLRNKKGNLEHKNIEQELDYTLNKSASISRDEIQNKETLHAYVQKAKPFVSNAQAALSEPMHQLLVKKALRQAQEEIDNIAKKEEKGSEKEKQVIPPLTRLEALYTIRNRERKYEQSKDFDSRSVKMTCSLRRIASVLSSRVTFWKKAGKASLLHKDLHSKKAKVAFRNSTKTKKGDALSGTIQAAKYTSLPIFEQQFFLYSDKSKDYALNELFTLSKGNHYIPYQSSAVLPKQKVLAFHTQSSSVTKLWHNRIPERWIVTPRLFFKLVDVISTPVEVISTPVEVISTPVEENICTDRKHSFFGEMSLPSKRLSAQEQKQIFQQKANPLLRVNNQKRKPTFVSPFFCTSSYELLKHNQLLVNKLDKVSTFNKQVSPARSTFSQVLPKQSLDTCYNANSSCVSNTVPLCLLSPFSVRSRPKYKKNEVVRFACKSKAYLVPKQNLGKTSGYVQKAKLFVQIRDAKSTILHAQQRFCVRDFVFTDLGEKNKVSLLKSWLTKRSFKELDTKEFRLLPDLVGIKNRIYFYDNLSQNKACQSSAPKVRNTALQSPVSHRIWQPKRMEASTFRVSQRNKKTSVLPRISQKDWKNIMEWQLRKYFVEEDKRLLPLSLNNNKTLKIKRLHFYLPWISLNKPTGLLNKQGWGFYSQQPAWWPLTGLDLIDKSNRDIDLQALFSQSSTGKEIAPSISEFSKVEGQREPKHDFYQDKVIVAQPRLNTFVLKEMQNLQNRLHLPKNSVCDRYFVDSQSTNYWRLPIQQNIYTVNRPVQKRWGIFNEHKLFTEPTSRDIRQISNRRSINTKVPITRSEKILSRDVNSAVTTKKRGGDYKKSINKYSPSLNTNQSILFESVTRYSWLFIYTFVFVLIFKQLFMFVYKVGLKDFFINFLNSEFGRTITSEEFRYSIQNSPLADFHMPKKRLQGLFGLEKNKVQLLEIVWFLRNHCQGRNGIRGVLLVGPPGVENVSVVQAIAGEANVPIIVQSLEKIAQDSEPQRQLEQLYMRAQKQAPCVLFLDQLDVIGARRDQLFIDNMRTHNDNWMQNKSLHQNSLNSLDSSSRDLGIEDNNLTLKRGVTSGNKLNVVLRLLTILDGITQSSGVVTVATARDITKLDPALLRPKRFDRRIYLSLPNRQDRVHLFKTETQSIGHAKEMPWDYLSLQTESMSAPDIRSAINYSLFKAVLQSSVHTVETLEYGVDCVKSLTDKRVKNS